MLGWRGSVFGVGCGYFWVYLSFGDVFFCAVCLVYYVVFGLAVFD